jgi:hypothetical protein
LPVTLEVGERQFDLIIQEFLRRNRGISNI